MSNNDTFTYKLSTPVTVDGKTITEVTLQRPRVKHQLNAARVSNNQTEMNANLLAEISGLSHAIVGEISTHDYNQMHEQGSVFFGAILGDPIPPLNSDTA